MSFHKIGKYRYKNRAYTITDRWNFERGRLFLKKLPVKFGYYLKFHGARTAFCRVIEGKMTSTGHRTVSGRRPVGVCTHRTSTGRFLFKLYRTMSEKHHELSSGHQPMFYESNCHRWEATFICRRTYCISRDISIFKTKMYEYKHIYYAWGAEDV